ncbi:hypothetical protein AB6F62_16625 [Providencia huaxiensis]
MALTGVASALGIAGYQAVEMWLKAWKRIIKAES